MNRWSFLDMINRAKSDNELLDSLTRRFNEAERAHEILRSKGYGAPGMSIEFCASLVPDARVIPL